MNKHSEDELNAKMKQDLDDSVDALDANTLSKIRQIRMQTVTRAEQHYVNWPVNRKSLFVGGLATACVMVLAVVLLLNSPTSMQIVPVDDIELISSSDNLELFEDLEFYEWLEEDGLQS
jgi:hypothetical protein